MQHQLATVMVAGRGGLMVLVATSSSDGCCRRHCRGVELLRGVDPQLRRRMRWSMTTWNALHTVGSRVGRVMQWRSAGCAVQCQRLRQLRMRTQDNRLDGKLLRHLLQVAEALQVTAGAEQTGGRVQLEGWQTARTGQRSSGSCARPAPVARRQLGRRVGGRGQRQGQREGQWQRSAQIPRLVVVHAQALLAVVGAVGGAARTMLQLQAARHRRVGAQ